MKQPSPQHWPEGLEANSKGPLTKKDNLNNMNNMNTETEAKVARRPRASLNEINTRIANFLALPLPEEFGLGDVKRLDAGVEATTIRLALKRGQLTSTGKKKGTKYRRA